MARKQKPTVDLDEAVKQLEAVKTLVIGLGLPYSNVRKLDDAISVIASLGKRLEFRYKDSSNG
jgi:hypothetical protein